MPGMGSDVARRSTETQGRLLQGCLTLIAWDDFVYACRLIEVRAAVAMRQLGRAQCSIRHRGKFFIRALFETGDANRGHRVRIRIPR